MSEGYSNPTLGRDEGLEPSDGAQVQQMTGVEYILSVQAAKRELAGLSPEATSEQVMEVAYDEFGHGGI